MKKKLLYILLFLIFILSIVGISELYLRVFHYEILKSQSYPNVYQTDPYRGFSFIPKSTSPIIRPSINDKIEINNQGFLGLDFSTSKSDSTFRILIVSNSMLLSNKGMIHQEFVRNKFSNVEIINCSIDGSFLNWHHYLMIKNKLIKYSPDVIFFNTEIPFSRKDQTRENYKGYAIEYSLINPEISRKKCTDIVDRIENNLFLTSLYDYSFIVRVICKKMVDKFEYLDYDSFTQKYIYSYRRKKVLSGDLILYEYSVDQTLNKLRFLSDTLSSAECQLVIFNFFSQQESDEMKLKFKEYGLNLINLDIDIYNYENELRLEHDGHPNEKGNVEIARTFFDKILENSIIPDQYYPKK